MKFLRWLARVDRMLVPASGVSIHDLGDWLWRDAYDNGLCPEAALRDFLADEAPELLELLDDPESEDIYDDGDDDFWHDDLSTWPGGES